MRRGELWWAELPPPIGRRPVLVLTRDAVLNSIDSIVVALVTRTARNLQSEVLMGPRDGLPMRSVASMDNLMTVPRQRLTRLLGSCTHEKVREVDAALRFALGLDAPS